MRRREGLMGRAAYDDEVDTDTSFNFLAATVLAAGVGGLVYFFMKAQAPPATAATNLPVSH